MAIIRIQFRDPVADFGESWTAAKEAGRSEVAQGGQWLTFRRLVPLGQRIRVPLSNVSSITEDDIVESPGKGAKE